jgi:hypothetical protein
MLMAIDEFNAKGGVLGRPIKWVHLDTETTPATGSRVAERLIQRDKVGVLAGRVSSGVANAISQVAQKYGVIYLNTNSSAPTESGENCHRVKFVWDGNGNNFCASRREECHRQVRQTLAAHHERLRVGARAPRTRRESLQPRAAPRSSTRSWCPRERVISRPSF